MSFSVRLVSLEEAKAQLSITNTDHDVFIDQKIAQASRMVMTYLKLDAVPAEWMTGSPLQISAPDDTKGVTLGVFAELFEGREASAINVDAIYRLLSMLPRDPTLA